MNEKSNLEQNSAHLSKSSTNFWANVVRNLKVFFALPKWLKIFLCVLSAVAVSGVIASFALMSWAKDNAQHGDFVLNGVDKAVQARLDSGFAYDGRLYFEKLDVLLRSKVIAYIDITEISWVLPIDKNAVSEIKSQNRHIKFISSQNLSEFSGQKLGVVEYKMDFSPLVWTILRYFAWIVVVIVGVCVFYNSFKIYPWRVAPATITRKDCVFLGFIFALCAGICAFTFWLGFPGFHNVSDIYLNIDLNKSNFAPVFISYVLELLYLLFGRHLYYLFLFNLVPFYLGIFFLIAGFYLRFKNPFALMVIFPTFIGNIYFENFIQHYSFSLSMLLFCLWALLLFIVLVPLDSSKTQKIIAKILWILLFVLMLFAILWRHNAIFSVFPAFFVIVYLFLKNRNLDSKTFIKNYIALTFLSAILCVFVTIFIPKILTKDESYPENHTLLHQIAGACAPANDNSCFKDKWYKEGKSFDDVKAFYEKYPLIADTILFGDEAVFKAGQKLDGLKTQWTKSILKHPINYVKHEFRFIKGMWIDKTWIWRFSAKEIQDRGHLQRTVQNAKGFPQNEQKVTFTPLKEKIYSFFYKYRIEIPHIISVCISAFVMIICGWFLWRKKYHSLITIFAFSAGFAGFWSAFFIALFIPIPVARYMSPVFAISIVALLGFVAFVLDYSSNKKTAFDSNNKALYQIKYIFAIILHIIKELKCVAEKAKFIMQKLRL